MRTIYPIYGLQGRMTLPWKLTKSGGIAVQYPDGTWLYYNQKTGWVPIPTGRKKVT